LKNPYEVLGLRIGADPDEIRSAYRAKAKKHHPDRFQDPGDKAKAHQKMIELNLAYEEALRYAVPHQQAPYKQSVTKEEAVLLAQKMLARNNAQSALRQLQRSETKDAAWYYTQGQVYMVLEDYENAHHSFRQAVKLSPDDNTYRTGALDATVALRRSQSVQGKIQKFFKGFKK